MEDMEYGKEFGPECKGNQEQPGFYTQDDYTDPHAS